MRLLQAGKDFPNNFDVDNFASRRTTGNNMFDPDGLITGDEIARGLTYKNSSRVFASRIDYLDAVDGRYTVEQVVSLFPRVSMELWAYGRSTVRQVMDASENEV